MSNFEELEVWKKAREIRLEIAELVKGFPADEKYKLRDQMIRCSRSVTANIAEGNGRYYYLENIQFCRRARGSLSELLDHLICAVDEGYLKGEILEYFRDKIALNMRMLNGYISYLKKNSLTRKE
jgi:four helix bundle protein